MKKTERELRKVAKRYKAKIVRGGSDHFRLTFPDGTVITTAASGTDPDISRKNLIQDIERYANAQKRST